MAEDWPATLPTKFTTDSYTETVADGRLGERVCIGVVLRAGQSLAPDELLLHLTARGLSKYDFPEYYLALDALPLTASGKVLKRALVEQVAGGQLRPQAVRPAKRAR